ncbi:MAG: class I SAM-dependent methyltransferase, partial [Deltaproteobacteria bacterium]|nr:class I SAM-dependent methyltransferase [Deltaproteobacteria bacterium]
MNPWMSEDEIRTLEEEFLRLERDHLDVLEWGCGGSTDYFTSFLRRNGVSYHWTSVEHNRTWYEKVAERLQADDDVEVHLFAAGDDGTPVAELPMDDYVEFPATLGRRFDFILVDGRKRKRCLEQAQQLLKPGGIVILHDANRGKYHGAFRSYPDSSFLVRKVWRGSNASRTALQRIGDKANYAYYRVIVKQLFKARERMRRLR